MLPALAIDCEMVQVLAMELGRPVNRSLAGRVSLVNEQGVCVYNTYIKHTAPITDYRTWVSGLTPQLLAKGKSFERVKREVIGLLGSRILVGHDLEKDLKSLELCHPDRYKRDTSMYPPFQTPGRPSLRYLAQKHLGLFIQNGEHDSVEDAIATMKLYKKCQFEWESWLAYGGESYDEERLQPVHATFYRTEVPSVNYSVAEDVCSCLTFLIKILLLFCFFIICVALYDTPRKT